MTTQQAFTVLGTAGVKAVEQVTSSRAESTGTANLLVSFGSPPARRSLYTLTG